MQLGRRALLLTKGMSGCSSFPIIFGTAWAIGSGMFGPRVSFTRSGVPSFDSSSLAFVMIRFRRDPIENGI